MRLRKPCPHERYDSHYLEDPDQPRTVCAGGEFLPEDARYLYWVQNADPEGDLGDYSGYKQSDWDEAVGVAGELVSDSYWHDGIEAAEVLELRVIRSLIVKAPAEVEEFADQVWEPG